MIFGSSFTALYDANVLYPNVLRDTLVSLAGTGLFRAKWTARIHDEWINAVLRNHGGRIERARLAKTRDLMDRAVPDCLVEGWDALEAVAAGSLPDPGDAHVLAAAIRCGASVIVTKNLKHFPAGTLKPYDIDAQHPDDFISRLIDLDDLRVCRELRQQRERWRDPPATVAEFLAALGRQELPLTVDALRGLSEFL